MFVRMIRVGFVAGALLQQPSGPAPVRPQFDYVGSVACVDMAAYAWTKELTELLTVRASLKDLNLRVGDSRRFDLAGIDAAALDVHITLFDRSPLTVLGCTDAGPGVTVKRTDWKGRSGTVTVSLAKSLDREKPYLYKAIISLEGLSFESPTGERIDAPEPIFLIGNGGWTPGG